MTDTNLPALPGAAASPPPANAGWKVRRVGGATFAISKPKRKANKLRQMRLKNRRRAR
ncbi:MAG TPA: hypothetical protein VKU44_04530 [Terriglobia bacterium]|nr:hypothetical protein [Terriglobia bacterium]